MALARHSHFLAHSSNVNCLRFGRKSGQVAATGGDDNLVNLWRLREKETKNIMSLSGHQSAVESIVFDPAEHKVVAGSQAGSIKVFDLEAGKVDRTLKGHMASTTTVDFHLYGDYVASGSRDTIVKVWDLRTKSCMQTFKGHSSEVTAVSFTPDGRWLTSGDQEGVIKIWDLTAGRLLHEFPDHGGAITSLEFNPEEFILVSSAADRTVRFWDVQEFALIGVTPVDNAATTSMSHTVTEPYSGKYLFCCSQEAIRVWSYETAIECHDSVMMPRQKELGHVEIHADTTMTQDMKLMGGCIQDAFVSVWVLDVRQMRPFSRTSSNNTDHGATEARGTSKPLSVRDPTPSAPEPVEQPVAKPVDTPTTHLPASRSASRESGNGSSNGPVAEATRPVCARLDTPAPAEDLPSQRKEQDVVTSDFVMELRCGMDTCIKAFKARQKCVQQLLVHWGKGHLHDGLRYIGELPKGKREAVLVDVLRITDLKLLGVDLEACVLLLPLIVEILESKFELYLSIGIDSGRKLFDAFSPMVKNARDARQYRSRAINLAGEERAQRCNTCDVYFQEMEQRVQQLVETCSYSSLQSKINTLARALGDHFSH
ncbi:katanin p80 subunit [Phytophthora infestans T30-4]|uniref:Katanin p80 WD40 repeat-containing subunit B1 homolog n=1 Tax=Phytophthora infestans (strain T30-4) TaxID=403677 RepID=D0NX09_PHYIT|nr:katanin p80 subunit [Phytophthora infestans T30-4]EEY67601.1 katanin p80 subunit [Phytophthora infestans T30-4]|eukprot:XP_002896366.1 katanin p80 subunit [Phytophthora infestans T30-4]